MLDKKQIWVISYSSSKWVVKQQRQLATSATHLAQELLMNIQHSGGSRSFVKETRAFKMRSTMAGHQKLTATNWEDHQSWSLYNYVRSCHRTQHQPKIKKSLFWSVIFSYSMQQKRTISGLDFDMLQNVDFIWQPAMTSSVVGPRKSSKALPQPKLAPKTGHSHCWPDPLQLSESQQSHYIWDVCSRNWRDGLKTAKPAVGVGQQKGSNPTPWQCPTTCCTTILQQLNKLGCKVLLHLPYSPNLLPTIYHFFKHLSNFLRGKCFHNQKEEENASQKFIKSWSMDLYATGINKFISCWQKCIDCNDSYFD